MQGQLELFEQYPLRTPCDRHCDCEWCSMVCFKRRGYIWDKTQHSWVYDQNGKALRTKNRECDWESRPLTPKELEEIDEVLN